MHCLPCRASYILAAFVIAAAVGWLVVAPTVSASLPPDLEQSELALLSEFFDALLVVERSRDLTVALDRELADTEAQIEDIETRIARGEEGYLEARSRTAAALRWLHRMGPVSYLEVLLGSTSLGDFMRRASLVTAAARGAVTALADVQSEKESLAHMHEELELLVDERDSLAEQREVLAHSEEELEKQRRELSGVFGARWSTVEDSLMSMVKGWDDEVRPFIQELPPRLAHLAEDDVELGDVSIEVSGFNVTALVPASSINRIFMGQPALRGTEFRFEEGEAYLVISELDTVMRGDLSVDRRGVIVYDIISVEFGGLTIEDPELLDAVERIALDLGPALQGLTPRSLTVKEGAVELVLSLLP